MSRLSSPIHQTHKGLPRWQEFDREVRTLIVERHAPGLGCSQQFVSVLFCNFAHRPQSVRDAGWAAQLSGGAVSLAPRDGRRLVASVRESALAVATLSLYPSFALRALSVQFAPLGKEDRASPLQVQADAPSLLGDQSVPFDVRLVAVWPHKWRAHAAPAARSSRLLAEG